MMNEYDINSVISEMHWDTNNISDWYHTFWELYEHRITLWVALCKMYARHRNAWNVWKSTMHSDWSKYNWWFILGIWKDAWKQMTYHLPDEWWDRCSFAEELEKAPEFDGHTSDDVLKRISNI